MARKFLPVVALVIATGLATLVMAFANRDVYSKEQVDGKIDTVEELANQRQESIDRELNYIQQDVRWLVRNQGGTPHADAGEDSNTP